MRGQGFAGPERLAQVIQHPGGVIGIVAADVEEVHLVAQLGHDVEGVVEVLVVARQDELGGGLLIGPSRSMDNGTVTRRDVHIERWAGSGFGGVGPVQLEMIVGGIGRIRDADVGQIIVPRRGQGVAIRHQLQRGVGDRPGTGSP